MLQGTSRADVIAGSEGADVIRGLGGNDTICGGRGPDDLVGDEGDDSMTAGAGTDGLFGGDGNDRLSGGDGDGDLLTGGPDNDEMDGGPGISDTALYMFSPTGVAVNLATGQAQGEGADALLGFEAVVGSELDDQLTGAGANEYISGESGNDVLAAGDGDDQLDGGGGDDQLDGGSGEDTVRYAKSLRPLILDLTSGKASGYGEDLLSEISDVFGSRFDDALIGDPGSNFLGGSEGNDIIEGRAGDDILNGGDGDNTLDGGEGQDTCLYGATRTSCEKSLMFILEPEFSGAILAPREGETLDAVVDVRLEGYAFNGVFGTGILDAQVALRLLSSEGCRWWSGERDRLIPGSCEDPTWNPARFEPRKGRGGPWSLQVSQLRPGWYQARLLVVMDIKKGKRLADQVDFRVS